MNEDYGFFLRAARRLEGGHTGVQALEVHDTPQFGRVLRLDGCFMTSEKEEFVYHENLAHPAAIAHAGPKRVLIVGGGDGGLAEEVLKHPSVERVTLVELDARVIEVAKQHFGAVHRGAFDDPRLEVLVADGKAFVAGTRAKFDLIALDLPDPVGPAAPLYETPFLRECKRALARGGALVLHMGSPWARPDRVTEIFRRLAGCFKLVRPYTMFIPLYGNLWSMAVCSDALDPTRLAAADVDARIAERGLRDLRYYNGATHQAVFALPNFVRDLTVGAVRAPPQAKKRAA
jgi:spermidine synthase